MGRKDGGYEQCSMLVLQYDRYYPVSLCYVILGKCVASLSLFPNP
jgi:hypothetical protein